VTLKLAETSVVKSRPSVPYGANLFLFTSRFYIFNVYYFVNVFIFKKDWQTSMQIIKILMINTLKNSNEITFLRESINLNNYVRLLVN